MIVDKHVNGSSFWFANQLAEINSKQIIQKLRVISGFDFQLHRTKKLAFNKIYSIRVIFYFKRICVTCFHHTLNFDIRINQSDRGISEDVAIMRKFMDKAFNFWHDWSLKYECKVAIEVELRLPTQSFFTSVQYIRQIAREEAYKIFHSLLKVDPKYEIEFDLTDYGVDVAFTRYYFCNVESMSKSHRYDIWARYGMLHVNEMIHEMEKLICRMSSHVCNT